MQNDQFLLEEFRKAIYRISNGQVIDLDIKFTHKFDFQVFRMEDVMRTAGPAIPPNKWSYYRIILIRDGSGSFTTGIHRFKADKNTLVVMPARIITSSRDWTPDTAGYVALFNIDFFLQNNFPHKFIGEKRILSSSTQPYIHVSEEQAIKIADIFETMLTEKYANREHKEELIALKIIELLIESERLFSETQHFEDNQPSLDIIKKFVDLIELHFLQERSVTFYANQLNVHPNYLNSLTRKHTGLTAKESIQNRILLETKYLLHSTTLSVKEISNQVGFDDPNYFAAFFKRFENMSPTSYRSSFV